MRIIFMGTPDFAVPSLEKLLSAGYDVAAVFTQPDKPKGRGNKLQCSPVKELALSRGIPVFQPVSLKKGDAESIISDINPDMIVVAAYGKILPQSILNIPRLGCVNVHGSLLPSYRGAAPIQWSVINGDEKTGITIMYMASGIDTGDMIAKREVPIGKDETSGELFDRLSLLGAELLADMIPSIEDGSAKPEKQDESLATYAPMISKDMADIDWKRPAGEVKNLIRGLNPWPCASSRLDGKKIKIFSAELSELNGEAGTAVNCDGRILVYCGEGSVILKEIQPENGKRMPGESYLLGHPINGKAVLG